jgi:hypothetical protein
VRSLFNGLGRRPHFLRDIVSKILCHENQAESEKRGLVMQWMGWMSTRKNGSSSGAWKMGCLFTGPSCCSALCISFRDREFGLDERFPMHELWSISHLRTYTYQQGLLALLPELERCRFFPFLVEAGLA